MSRKYICIDIGGTSIKHGVLLDVSCPIEEEDAMTAFGRVPEYGHGDYSKWWGTEKAGSSLFFLDKGESVTPIGGALILKKVLEIIKAYRAKNQGPEFGGICLSCAGMIDVEKGSVFHAGPTIADFVGTAFRDGVIKAFGLPCEIENDVNCAGLAESISGAGRGCGSMVCLTVGTGIGGCAVIDGKVVRGNIGSAMEVGYIEMEGGRYEDLGAASVMTKRVAAEKGQTVKEWKGNRIFDAARAGDEICREAIADMCDALGRGIATICYVLNPQLVVLGGGIMAQKDYLYPLIRASMDRNMVPVLAKNTELKMAEHGNDAGMLGAYYHFRTTKRPVSRIMPWDF